MKISSRPRSAPLSFPLRRVAQGACAGALASALAIANAAPDGGAERPPTRGPGANGPGTGAARDASLDGGAGDAAKSAGRAALDDAGLASLLSAIANARANVATLRSSFTQERTMSLLATRVSSRGALTFVAPDRLRWELTPPDDVVYWVGPEGLSFRTRSSKATMPKVDAKIARGLTDLRALLGGDLRALGERYVLRGARGAGDVEITGTAKDPKASIRGFAVVLDEGLVLPRSARLLEGKSDAVEITFSNGAVNGPVDPRTMRP